MGLRAAPRGRCSAGSDWAGPEPPWRLWAGAGRIGGVSASALRGLSEKAGAGQAAGRVVRLGGRPAPTAKSGRRQQPDPRQEREDEGR
jgi:hypothetical protein